MAFDDLTFGTLTLDEKTRYLACDPERHESFKRDTLAWIDNTVAIRPGEPRALAEYEDDDGPYVVQVVRCRHCGSSVSMRLDGKKSVWTTFGSRLRAA